MDVQVGGFRAVRMRSGLRSPSCGWFVHWIGLRDMLQGLRQV